MGLVAVFVVASWVTFRETAPKPSGVSLVDIQATLPRTASRETDEGCPGWTKASPKLVSPQLTVVAIARSSATIVQGRVGNVQVEVMLDSGVSISLIRKETAKRLLGLRSVRSTNVHVVSATGDPIAVLGCAIFAVHVGPLHVDHCLVVVNSLITPVILGIDFM